MTIKPVSNSGSGVKIYRVVDAGFTPISDVPDSPTPGSVSVGAGRGVTVNFTASATGGVPTSYTVTSVPGGYNNTGASSPVVVTVQAPDTYRFTITAINSTGSSAPSALSSSVIVS